MRGSVPLCPVSGCPLVQRIQGFQQVPETPRGRDLLGPSPPAVFVGRHGYPKVTVGPLLPPAAAYDPRVENTQALQGMGIGEILALRSNLVRSRAPVTVTAPQDPSKALEVSRELAMAAKPVDTEVTLAKDLRLVQRGPRLDGTGAPMGPGVDVVRARLTQNPSVPRRVDALVSDVHADAATGVAELYEAGIPVDQTSRLLSVGLLGEGARRKLVPTRWSITATDDTVGKHLVEDVKNQQLVGEIEYAYAELFGNHFHVLLLPRPWSFEMLEAWQEEHGWGLGRDAEGFQGRTSYASNVTGAYYAARLAVLEHLRARGRQAAALVYREITDAYWAPLGVWVIREGVRNALRGKRLSFGEVEAVARHVLRRARYAGWVPEAQLLKGPARQRTLGDYA